MTKIPSELEDKLGFNIHRVNLLFRREIIRALAEYEITPEQWQILMTLWHTSNPITQKEIADMTLKDKHSVSRMIRKMEKNGLITKTAASQDARASLINLSEKGKELKNTLVGIMKNTFTDVWSDITIEEKDNLLRTLRKLRNKFGDL